MEILIVILRLAHILLGVIWVGFGILSAWVLHPVAKRMGDNGQIMLRTFYGYSRYQRVMPVAAVGTTVAGLILWPLRSTGGNLLDLLSFTTTGDVVMVIGAVAGLLAFGHGAAATGRYSDQFIEAAKDYDSDPNEANQTTLDAAREKIFTHANISAWISLVAVVCMAGARYLG